LRCRHHPDRPRPDRDRRECLPRISGRSQRRRMPCQLCRNCGRRSETDRMITMPGASLAGPAVVAALLADLLSSEPRPAEELHLTYLRRKAGRGLVAVYGSASDPGDLYTVTVAESACTATPPP